MHANLDQLGSLADSSSEELSSHVGVANRATLKPTSVAWAAMRKQNPAGIPGKLNSHYGDPTALRNPVYATST